MKTEEVETFETIARRESRKERRTAVSAGSGGTFGPRPEKTRLWVSDKASFKPVSSATETS